MPSVPLRQSKLPTMHRSEYERPFNGRSEADMKAAPASRYARGMVYQRRYHLWLCGQRPRSPGSPRGIWWQAERRGLENQLRSGLLRTSFSHSLSGLSLIIVAPTRRILLQTSDGGLEAIREARCEGKEVPLQTRHQTILEVFGRVSKQGPRLRSPDRVLIKWKLCRRVVPLQHGRLSLQSARSDHCSRLCRQSNSSADERLVNLGQFVRTSRCHLWQYVLCPQTDVGPVAE